jgi:hypothetical protein
MSDIASTGLVAIIGERTHLEYLNDVTLAHREGPCKLVKRNIGSMFADRMLVCAELGVSKLPRLCCLSGQNSRGSRDGVQQCEYSLERADTELQRSKYIAQDGSGLSPVAQVRGVGVDTEIGEHERCFC